MLWEAIFLLVILKIPVVYVCVLVWWAIRAEPTHEGPLDAAPVSDTPMPPSWSPSPRGGGRRRPDQRPTRRPHDPRPTGARVEVRR